MKKSKAVVKKAQGKVSARKLVLEHHYSDGDCGAYSAAELPESRHHIDALWTAFSKGNKGHRPSHIVIRHNNAVGQEMSNRLHTAAKFDLKRNIEQRILSAVSSLKDKAKYRAKLSGVRYDESYANAGEIFWIHGDTAEIAYAAMDCGIIAVLFAFADEQGLILSANVAELRDWSNVIHPS